MTTYKSGTDRLIEQLERMAIERDRTILAARIAALPTYGTLISKGDVLAIVTDVRSSEGGAWSSAESGCPSGEQTSAARSTASVGTSTGRD